MTRTPSETRAPRGREAWLEAALDTLAESGVDGLRVESLAKRLGLTKGSFYWHFRDRPSLLAELLQRWREGRMDAIHRHAGNGAETPRERLLGLLSRYEGRVNPRGMAIEMAVREWARRDAEAAAVVAAVDAERLAVVSGLFGELGYGTGEARTRAYLFYAYVFGQSLLAPAAAGSHDALRESAAALLTEAP
jgi:AcrR family transcriptional regulator